MQILCAHATELAGLLSMVARHQPLCGIPMCFSAVFSFLVSLCSVHVHVTCCVYAPSCNRIFKIYINTCLQASLQGRHHLSALLGAFAVMFRQTNAVWVAFILGAAVVRWAAAGGGDKSEGAAEKLRFERAAPGRQMMHVMRMSWLVGRI